MLLFVFLHKGKGNSSNLGETISDTEQSRYNFFLEKYNKEEIKIIENADKEIKTVQAQIDVTSDPIKILFLRSYIEHYKFDKLSRLINYSKYSEGELTDIIDPLFASAAEKVVTNQKCDYVSFLEWFGYNFDLDRFSHIRNQLIDSGILYNNFEDSVDKICIDSLALLKRIIAKTNIQLLLTKDEKQKLNEYFENRRQELIGNNALISDLSTGVSETYNKIVSAFDALSSSEMKWEIVSSKINTEAKSSANTLVDKKSVYTVYKKNFNFLKPCKDISAPFFEFKQGGLSFYIYPEFVIAARSATNFDVIKINDFNISFRKQNFVETNNYSIPKDAKLVRYTYNYVNKNGIRCCDAVKELDLIYKKAVIKERKENLEKDFTDETEGT